MNEWVHVIFSRPTAVHQVKQRWPQTLFMWTKHSTKQHVCCFVEEKNTKERGGGGSGGGKLSSSSAACDFEMSGAVQQITNFLSVCMAAGSWRYILPTVWREGNSVSGGRMSLTSRRRESAHSTLTPSWLNTGALNSHYSPLTPAQSCDLQLASLLVFDFASVKNLRQ